MSRRKSARTTSRTRKYATFLRKIRLIGIGLTNCSVQLDRFAYAKLAKNPKQVIRNITAEYSLGRSGEGFMEPRAEFKFSVSDESSGIVPLKIECTFESHFHPSAPDQEAGERFAREEFAAVIWPYFRQFVADTTSRMAIRPVTIPLTTTFGAQSRDTLGASKARLKKVGTRSARTVEPAPPK